MAHTGFSTLRGVVGAALIALATVATPAAAQEGAPLPADEVFQEPEGAAGLLARWNGQPYLGVLGACAGVSEAYRQIAVQTNDSPREELAKNFLATLRQLMMERIEADPQLQAEPTPEIVEQNWINGLTVAQNALANNPDRAPLLLENTARECVNAVINQERRMGRGSTTQ